MYDDGTHGDDAAGDGVWSVQHAPLPEGSQVTYRARATDADGNSYRYPGLNSFKVLPPFVKTAAILFVPDAGGNNTPSDTAWFQSYYTDALEALGYRYDTWDTATPRRTGQRHSQPVHARRGDLGRALLGLCHRIVGPTASGALQAYLDAGGKLFITGQNIAEAFPGVALASSTITCMRPFEQCGHRPVCPGRRGRRSHR